MVLVTTVDRKQCGNHEYGANKCGRCGAAITGRVKNMWPAGDA